MAIGILFPLRMLERWPKGLILLFLVSVVIRAGWVLLALHADSGLALNPDSPSYLRPAIALLKDHRFLVITGGNQPEFFRTPGYPLFLAITFAIFGQNNLFAVGVIQAILSAGTVVLTFLIAERLWTTRTAWIAAIFVLLEPLQMLYTSLILTETIATFLLILALYFTICAIQQELFSPWQYLLAGLSLACSIMVRPGNYYLGALIPLVILWKFGRNFGYAKPLLLFLLPVFVIVGGWKFRNHYAVDSWRLSYVDSQSLYLARAAGIVAIREEIAFKDARKLLRKQFGNRQKNESIGHYYERMRNEGIQIIRNAHPSEIIAVTLDGLRGFFGGFPFLFLLNDLGVPKNAAISLASQILLCACYLLVALGVVISFRSKDVTAHLLLLVTVAYITVVSATNPMAYSRYRVPLMPVFCMYAAAGVNWLHGKMSKGGSP